MTTRLRVGPIHDVQGKEHAQGGLESRENVSVTRYVPKYFFNAEAKNAHVPVKKVSRTPLRSKMMRVGFEPTPTNRRESRDPLR